ncbi:hypothetical protein R3P38DRAFT_3206443 [Favolaschia claudopus]|uniref:Uncharacterized protein n=1 Tax=Favolaschia claudopus TaxID=2862362 RepID=A0AAW0AL30_9AGAR
MREKIKSFFARLRRLRKNDADTMALHDSKSAHEATPLAADTAPVLLVSQQSARVVKENHRRVMSPIKQRRLHDTTTKDGAGESIGMKAKKANNEQKYVQTLSPARTAPPSFVQPPTYPFHSSKAAVSLYPSFHRSPGPSRSHGTSPGDQLRSSYLSSPTYHDEIRGYDHSP